MTTGNIRIFLGTVVLACCLTSSPVSYAGYMFDLDFTRDNPAGGGTLDAGKGTIDLPSLIGNAETGVILDVEIVTGSTYDGIVSFKFTESDIQSIAWAVASDTTILSSLNLKLSKTFTGNTGISVNPSVIIDITDNSGSYDLSGTAGTFVQLRSIGYATSIGHASVPVPPILMLYGIGLAALGWSRRKRD